MDNSEEFLAVDPSISTPISLKGHIFMVQNIAFHWLFLSHYIDRFTFKTHF